MLSISLLFFDMQSNVDVVKQLNTNIVKENVKKCDFLTIYVCQKIFIWFWLIGISFINNNMQNIKY